VAKAKRPAKAAIDSPPPQPRVVFVYGKEPDANAHPDLFAAWHAAKCAAGHALFLDGLTSHEKFDYAARAWAGLLVANAEVRRQFYESAGTAPPTITAESGFHHYLKYFHVHHEKMFSGPVEPLAAELRAAAGGLVTVCGLSGPCAHLVAVRSFAWRLWTIFAHSPSFDAKQIAQAWPALRGELLAIAKLADWQKLASMIETEHLAVAERRAEAAGAQAADSKSPYVEAGKLWPKCGFDGYNAFKAFLKEYGVDNRQEKQRRMVHAADCMKALAERDRKAEEALDIAGDVAESIKECAKAVKAQSLARKRAEK
jgi:hypothetical protein